jgi:lysine N6-hydroxylase
VIPHYDLVGIGIGPFNLGLAALSHSVPGLTTRFFERRPSFHWHPGIMIEGTTLQVSYLADLVTLVDPSSRFTYLAYMKSIGRLYQFAIRDSSYISRREYNNYCRWVAAQLPELSFGADVTRVEADPAGGYHLDVVTTDGSERIHAGHVVVGIGTTPSVPGCVPASGGGLVLHSGDYLTHREAALASGSVVLVGSGQSAGEIFQDVLEKKADRTQLTWLTRSPRFFPMDYSKLAVEMAAPDYIDHFYQLAPAVKAEVLAAQDSLYKGINLSLIDRIYDTLYERTIDGERSDVHLVASCELDEVVRDAELTLRFTQQELGQRFELPAETLILATGYAYRMPACLAPLRERIAIDDEGRPVITRGYEIACDPGGLFVQNAELHSHGFTAPDLSLGPYRNATILNAIAGEERFALERRIAFQDFGVPPHARALAMDPYEERTNPGTDRVAARPAWAERSDRPRVGRATTRAEDAGNP